MHILKNANKCMGYFLFLEFEMKSILYYIKKKGVKDFLLLYFLVIQM